MIKRFKAADPRARSLVAGWSPLSQAPCTARLVLLIAALANPFGVLLCFTVAKSALVDLKGLRCEEPPQWSISEGTGINRALLCSAPEPGAALGRRPLQMDERAPIQSRWQDVDSTQVRKPKAHEDDIQFSARDIAESFADRLEPTPTSADNHVCQLPNRRHSQLQLC